MKLTKANFRDVMAGGKPIWVCPGAFAAPYKVYFMGIHDGKAVYFNAGKHFETIDLTKPTSNIAFKEGRLCTTQDSAVQITRELCEEEIEYFNSRTLKNNPIPICQQ